MIGGNVEIKLQTKIPTKTAIGEYNISYEDYMVIKGWLDLNNVDNRFEPYRLDMKESTHVFICDYVNITEKDTILSAVINGKRYDVTYIDDPQNRHMQTEIYLKYVGD